MNFADRLIDAQRGKNSIAVLGIDPQLESKQGIPKGYTVEHFCCEIVEACASSVVAVKLQLAFFEARGIRGMEAFSSVVKFARGLGLITIADAKRADIPNTSAAYAEAFLGSGDFACDAVCVNPYVGRDGIMPFAARARAGRGVFVLVKTSNPSSWEFQDLRTPEGAVWNHVARSVHGLSCDYIGDSGLSSIGAVVGATYPDDAIRARELMPNAITLVPGYGAQGATAHDAVAGARADGLGIIVNASRSIMYAFAERPDIPIAVASEQAAQQMRLELNRALTERVTVRALP
ncbi:MAG: orotidine-5'-phosphate decarboxylase [Deltaproteobacteria bacterium]|nr:orotidine-5'-phosphate decarboxylase [Deltaproteobacteria bacterium]